MSSVDVDELREREPGYYAGEDFIPLTEAERDGLLDRIEELEDEVDVAWAQANGVRAERDAYRETLREILEEEHGHMENGPYSEECPGCAGCQAANALAGVDTEDD